MSESTISHTSSNGSHRHTEPDVTGGHDGYVAPVLPIPRRGGEASWPDPAGAEPKLPNFSSSPVSAAPPARERHPVIDIVIAGIIALVVAASAALYVSGGFNHTPHHHNAPSSSDGL